MKRFSVSRVFPNLTRFWNAEVKGESHVYRARYQMVCYSAAVDMYILDGYVTETIAVPNGMLRVVFFITANLALDSNSLLFKCTLFPFSMNLTFSIIAVGL